MQSFIRLFLMCLEETSFGSCSAWRNRGQMIHFEERRKLEESVGLEETLQINYKMSFIKDNFWIVRQHFMCTSHWLFLGHYILNWTTKNAYTWICLQNCLKELAINTGKSLKNIAASNISKNSALVFLPYFKNKYFLEHLTMATSGNIQNMLYCIICKYILAFNSSSSKIFFLI